MDALPNELIWAVLEYLPIRKVILLKAVCKRWKSIIDSFYIKSLSVFDYTYYHKQSMNSLNSLVFKTELFHLLKGQFKMLKKLTFYLRFDSLIKEEVFFNKFTYLEELNIKSVLSDKIKLNLNKLKKFKGSESCKIIFNTPALEHLVVYSLRKIDLEYPMNLKHLKVFHHLSSTDNRKLKEYKNLESLIVKRDDLGMINNLLLEQDLVNLKELHISDTFTKGYLGNFFTNPYDTLTYRSKNLKIYINGFDIDLFKRQEGNDEYFFREDRNLLTFLKANYHLVDKIRNKYELDYNLIVDVFGNKLPNDLVDKLRIKKLKISDKVEDLQLLKFINDFQPKCLSFNCLVTPFNSFVSFSFLDQLTKSGNQIREIAFEIGFGNFYKEENYRFLKNMKNLNFIRFRLRTVVPADFLIYLTKLNCPFSVGLVYEIKEYQMASIRLNTEGLFNGRAYLSTWLLSNSGHIEKRLFFDSKLEIIELLEFGKKQFNNNFFGYEEFYSLVVMLQKYRSINDFIVKKWFRNKQIYVLKEDYLKILNKNFNF